MPRTKTSTGESAFLNSTAGTATKRRAATKNTKKKAAPPKKKSNKNAAAPKKKAPPAPPSPSQEPLLPQTATNAPKENVSNSNSSLVPPVQTLTNTLVQPPAAPPIQLMQGASSGGAANEQGTTSAGGNGAPGSFGMQAPVPFGSSGPQFLQGPNGMQFILLNGQVFPVQQLPFPTMQHHPFPSAPSGNHPQQNSFGQFPPFAAAPQAPLTAPTAPVVPTVAAAPTNTGAAPSDKQPDYLSDLAKEADNHVLLGDTEKNDAIRGRSNGSQTYHNRKMKEFNDFCHWVGEHAILARWAELVPHAEDASKQIPKWIRALQLVSPSNKQAQSVLNTILIEYFEEQKSRDGRKLMQPQSLHTKLKKLFSVLSGEFGVRVGIKHLKGPGSLESHCQARWKEVREHDPTFGAKPFREIFSNDELKTVVAFIRNGCDVPSMTAQVAVVSLGRHLAFRGRQDYRNLEWHMVSFGVYEQGHPFAGQEYVEIGGGLLHKNHEITLSNPTAPCDVSAPKVPVDMQDPFNPGYILRLLRSQTPPNAKYVFMAQAKQGIQMQYLASGRPGAALWRYHENIRMGESAIGACTQTVAKLAGLPNWQKKTNHCLRQNAITDLVNNPDVTDIEAAKHARHKGTGTLPQYVRPTADQEAKRTAALEVATPEPPKTPSPNSADFAYSWI